MNVLVLTSVDLDTNYKDTIFLDCIILYSNYGFGVGGDHEDMKKLWLHKDETSFVICIPTLSLQA
jgi:hypothetical protein